MKKAIGIVDLHNNPSLGKLTEPRPLGSVSFLGRYGCIDFALSNFSNSDINKIEILVENGFDGIRSHLQQGIVWTRNTRTGFLRATINEDGLKNPDNNTDIANITKNIPLEVFDEEYVIVASPAFLMSLDYRDVLRFHGANDAGITIVYSHVKNGNYFENCDRLLVDSESKAIRKFLINDDENEANISLESYIFRKDVFLSLIKFSNEISNMKTTIRNMVKLFTDNRMVKVCGYEFKGYVAPILSLKHYINESFKLLDYKNRCQLFNENWKIYTTTHNTPPSLYGPKSDVSNSFIANGAVINGKVKNSIICREVHIGVDAVVSDAIIFSRTVVGDGVKLKKIVTDKNVVIEQVKNLSGDDSDYLLIAKGAKI